MKYLLSTSLVFDKSLKINFFSDFRYKYPIITDIEKNNINKKYEFSPNSNKSLRLKLYKFELEFGHLCLRKKISFKEKVSQVELIKIMRNIYILDLVKFFEIKSKFKVKG